MQTDGDKHNKGSVWRVYSNVILSVCVVLESVVFCRPTLQSALADLVFALPLSSLPLPSQQIHYPLSQFTSLTILHITKPNDLYLRFSRLEIDNTIIYKNSTVTSSKLFNFHFNSEPKGGSLYSRTGRLSKIFIEIRLFFLFLVNQLVW